MFPEIAASSEVDTLVAVLVGSQLGGVYGTIEALFRPNTSGVVAGVAAGVVGAVDIVLPFLFSNTIGNLPVCCISCCIGTC